MKTAAPNLRPATGRTPDSAGLGMARFSWCNFFVESRIATRILLAASEPSANRRRVSLPALAGALLGLGFATGCATPGPLHLYSMSAAPTGLIHDAGPEPRRDVPDFLAPGETVTGFAYDPFTDHFFLRLAPGNRLRVVDRPARAVKREFVGDALPATGGGDVAVWPHNGHLFLADPRAARVIELTRLGAWVREIPLAGRDSPAAGLAFDPTARRLLVLAQTTPGLVTLHDLEGRAVGRITLERDVRPSLAFDGEAREYYAPLAEPPGTIGIFDEHGRLRRTQRIPADFIDVGPRSFLRMF